MVYGEDFCKERVVGCQWHFLSDVKKKANLLPEASKEHFTAICRKLCNSTTGVSQYNLLKGRLEGIAKKCDTLVPWIKWLDVRRSHIFAPFRGAGLPRVNLSEIENAGWKPSNTLFMLLSRTLLQ